MAIGTDLTAFPGLARESPDSLRLAMVSCCYCNQKDRMMILRCVGPGKFFLEKVLFPFDAFGFEAPEQSDIQLWSSETSLEETLEVVQLQILQTIRGVSLETASAPV